VTSWKLPTGVGLYFEEFLLIDINFIAAAAYFKLSILFQMGCSRQPLLFHIIPCILTDSAVKTIYLHLPAEGIL
jgi:hypothetical protein